MSQAPSMPLFCDAYLADTMHLSLEEHGAYLKLLMITWRNNGQPLPDDDARIARMLGIPVSRWTKYLRPVIVPFFDVSSGFLRQKRLEKEWNYCAAVSARNSANGKRGGRPKSLKNTDMEEAAASAPVTPEESRGEAPRPRPRPSQAPAAESAPDAGDDGTGSGNAAADADAVIGGLDAAIHRHFGPSRSRKAPHPTDRSAARRALSIGAEAGLPAAETARIVADVCEAKCRKSVVSGRAPPNTLKLFAEEIEAAIRDAGRAARRDAGRRPEAAGGSNDAAPLPAPAGTPEFWRKWLGLRARTGAWPVSICGPEPGFGGCRVPPEILAEFGGAEFGQKAG